MRRFLFGVVIASVTAAMPVWAFGGDREIAKTVMSELQQQKAAGNLKGFDIDLKVQEGIVYLTGEVANENQWDLVTNAAASAVGGDRVVNQLSVKGQAQPVLTQTAVQPASTSDSAQPSDRDIAITDAVISKLQQSKSAGRLRGFELDVSTVAGDVWVKGNVKSQAQKDLVLNIARNTQGVSRVIDDVNVGETLVRQVSTEVATMAPTPIPQDSSPTYVNTVAAPQAYAPSGLVNASTGGAPVPMQAGGAMYGAGAPRYDQPNMPSYAWPSYAAYPNYGAVTYPKQYSPSAWPYIGPFYPYPQVPLGWRKVTLEWDDGLWYLDFTSKH